MNASERGRNEKKVATLLHAANDMIESTVAGEWLPEVLDNPFRAQVIRTGMVVAYGRIFAKADHQLDRVAYRPADAGLADLHDRMIWWRNKVYAHTDKAGGRTASITPRTATGAPIVEWTRDDFPRAPDRYRKHQLQKRKARLRPER